MTTEPTRDQIRAGIEAQICPWCGNGPFKILAGHTTRLHGVDRLLLRDLAGLFYKDPVCAPEVSEDRRERMRQPGSYVPTPSGKGYKKQPSRAAREQSRRNLAAARSDEQTKTAQKAAHTPEAKAKRSATMRGLWRDRRGGELEHGDYRRYKAGCRCDACKAANSAHFREYRASAHCAACGHDRSKHNGKTHMGFCGAEGCECRRWSSQRNRRTTKAETTAP